MDWLTEQIATLRDREQLILSLYYTDEMNLKEIGAILDISESRVSQILTKTVNTLRSKIV
jgi:RNA polymerase sigma factor for flagellar operon FliA